MKIKNLSITNVKSFKSDFFEFDANFNIIVGPNASGKSNLLDIITITLRKFFLPNFTFPKDSVGKFMPNMISTFSDHIWQKHYDQMISDSIIDFTFIITAVDIEYIKAFQTHQSDFASFLHDHVANSYVTYESAIQIGWDPILFKPNEEISYKIINQQPEIALSYQLIKPVKYENDETGNKNIDIHFKKEMFLLYLSLYDWFNLFQSETKKDIVRPNFLFLGPYRMGNANSDFQSNISTTRSATLISGLSHSTSTTNTSLINIATTYFAEKRRRFEYQSKEMPFGHQWDKDNEVVVITKYLNRLGYKWDMTSNDPYSGIYEIELEKDGHKLALKDASSGEKEIFNYLFGIFALKIQDGIIIVDEPELHLHPRWQLLLMELFIDLTIKTGNQFIITTHSPVFIQPQSLSNLIRIYKENNESKHISLIGSGSSNVKDELHIVNTTNNEKIFFADMVILVEGITDYLVFRKILNVVLYENKLLHVVEIVEIKGKTNVDRFRDFLDRLKIPNYFIPDLDYVNEVGSGDVKQLFVTNYKKIDESSIKKKSSSDNKKLSEILEKAIEDEDLGQLKDFFNYLKSFRTKLKDPLSSKEQKILNNFVRDQKKERNYLMNRGEIEDYFPEAYKSKNLENVIKLLKDENFAVWQSENGYKELAEIVVQIFFSAGILSTK